MAGAHVDFDFEGNVIGEVQSPAIVGTGANVAVTVVLRDAEIARGAGDGVIDSGCAGRTAVGTIRLEEMAGAAAQVDVTRAQLQSRANGLGILAVNGMRLMLHGVDGATTPTIEFSSASKESNQHNDESDGAHGRAQGGATSWGVRVFAALPAIINFPGADE